MFEEFNNRQIANKFAEYITGEALRKYVAEKVKKYVGENVSVFDGAVGSGQLEQYVQPSFLEGVDIQANPCEAAKRNFPNSHITNASFFAYDNDIVCDAVIMNPPFSIKLKDLEAQDIQAIQKEFEWKKSGVVDDIFVLKSLKYTKRYGFYILFPGLTYRKGEAKFRQLLGNTIVELNKIDNAFEDTSISVLFLVIDKEKDTSDVYKEIYNCKTEQVVYSETVTEDLWQLPVKPTPKEEIDIDAVNEELNNLSLRNLENRLAQTLLIIQEFQAEIDYLAFIKRVYRLVEKYEMKYKAHLME